MQPNIEEVEVRTNQVPCFLKIRQWMINHERKIFILLVAFMAAWGWVTLYEVNHVKPYLLQESFDLGIAIAVFVLIQLIDLKWLEKTYWVWLPLAVIGQMIYSNFGSYHGRLAELYPFNVGAGLMTGIICVIYFSGLWAKDSRNLSSRVFPDKILQTWWYPVLKKIVLTAYILLIATIYSVGIFVMWFIPLVASCMIIPFVLKKYWTGLTVVGINLLVFLQFIMGDPRRLTYFLRSPIAPELYQKLLSGGFLGTWTIPAASHTWWKFANGNFVFATVGQVHGLLGITCLLVLFLLFGYFGLRAAVRSENRFSAVLVLSMTTMILAGVMMSSLSGCGLLGYLGHTSIPFFTYGVGDLLLGAIGAGLIFKQLRLKSEVNLLQINVRRLSLVLMGLALIVWIKTLLIMALSQF